MPFQRISPPYAYIYPLDPCILLDIMTRFQCVFEWVGLSWILLCFNNHPAFIPFFLQHEEDTWKIYTAITGYSKASFQYSFSEPEPFFTSLFHLCCPNIL